MKIKIILFILVLSTVWIGCKESSTDPPPAGNQVADESYFPTADGAYYKYDIMRPDSNGTQTTGTRSSYYSGAAVIGGRNYQVQIDSLVLTGQAAIVDSMFFRKTNSGIFFYLDTTGLAASVPGFDTLLQYITLDDEMRLLLLPLFDNSEPWNVFSMNVNIPPLQPFSAVVLRAAYEGKEDLNLNLTPPRNVEAVRLKFTLTLKLDPFASPRTYTAFGWIAPGIGFVKWQGNGTIVGVFTGNGVDFDDTTSVFTQDITHFNLIDN